MMNVIYIIFYIVLQFIFNYVDAETDENQNAIHFGSNINFDSDSKVSEKLWNWLLTAIITLAVLSTICLICLIVWAVVYYQERQEEKEEGLSQNGNKTNYWRNEYTPGKFLFFLNGNIISQFLSELDLNL